MLKNNFKEELTLRPASGAADDATSVPGRRSPLHLINPEANIDYIEDYGFPEVDEYELLTATMKRGCHNDFATTLKELQATGGDVADFFGPLVERLKVLDQETLRFHDDVATFEESIRSFGMLHSTSLEANRKDIISLSRTSSSSSI
jgi:hypothetical protein